MDLLYSSVPVSRGSVTVSQHGQYQNPETEAAKWNSAIIDIYTCDFPAVTCQNVFHEKDLQEDETLWGNMQIFDQNQKCNIIQSMLTQYNIYVF